MIRFLKWRIWFQAARAQHIRTQEDSTVAKSANFGRGIPRFGFFWWYWIPWVRFNMGVSIYWLCFVVALNALPVAWAVPVKK